MSAAGAAIAVAKASGIHLKIQRQRAREAAIAAIRSLEAAVVDALGGEKLRGLPNLGTRRIPFHGTRVVESKERGYLPMDGREVLVLADDGSLVAVARHQSGIVAMRRVHDEELVMEDLQRFAAVVADSMDRHVALVERRTRDVERAESLARKILAIVSE